MMSSMFSLFFLQILDILNFNALYFWLFLELAILEYCIVSYSSLMCWDLLLVVLYFGYVL